MAAPIEAAVGAAFDARLDGETAGSCGGGLRGELRGLIREAADPLWWPAMFVLDDLAHDGFEDEPAVDSLVWGLTPAEAREAIGAIEALVARVGARCEAMILEELTAAGAAFVRAHPRRRIPRKVPRSIARLRTLVQAGRLGGAEDGRS